MRQAGAALLVMMAILAIGVSSLMVAALNQAASNETATASNRNAAVLAEAKSALIGHVVRQALDLTEDIPGRLPCPESPSDAGTANEGRAGSACSPTFPTNKTVGRLPWRTIGISKLVDAASEPLWYVVSPSWVVRTPNPPPVINAGSGGELTVDGVGDVVALIIAPGRPLVLNPSAAQLAQGCQARVQTRADRGHNPAGGNPDYRNYLECQNASSPIDTAFGTSVVDNATNLVLNDQAVVITARELMNALQGPLAERLQRTVAPLLSEYSSLWPGGKFLPYAAGFIAPESSRPAADHCGPSAAPQTREGLLPIAPNSGATCGSDWTSFAVSGSGTLVGCTTLASTNVQCAFQYYTLNWIGALLFGSSTYADITIQAVAPHAAASFRKPLARSDIAVTAATTAQSVTLDPQTDGDARMTLVVRVSGVDMCDSTVLAVACSVLAGLGMTSSPATATVEFPQLAVPMLQGTKLSAAIRAFKAPPYNLLAPSANDPHYWFMQNGWYRYTYYAVSPSASADAAGGNITVSGFPSANGSNNDKRFVLTLMGPPVAAQVRGPGATLANYIEGANAATTASPRVFAYQVYAASGNDRIATCPFNDGTASACD